MEAFCIHFTMNYKILQHMKIIKFKSTENIILIPIIDCAPCNFRGARLYTTQQIIFTRNIWIYSSWLIEYLYFLLKNIPPFLFPRNVFLPPSFFNFSKVGFSPFKKGVHTMVNLPNFQFCINIFAYLSNIFWEKYRHTDEFSQFITFSHNYLEDMNQSKYLQ